MWAPVQLPYFRNSEDLPGPLPTREDIRSSTTFLGDRVAQKMVRVGQHFIVKYGCGTSENEGQNLLFVEHHLCNIVHAPRLYAMYRDSDGTLFLIMEFLEGESLEKLWNMLSDDEKSHITCRLKVIFDGMRSLPSPGFYGSVIKGSIPHHLFYTNPVDRRISGPFLHENEVNSAITAQLRRQAALNRQHSHKSNFYERHLFRILSNHPPVFSHSDIYRKNILIRKTSKHSSEKCDYDVALVDWEDAGWYPSYWDYAISFTHFRWDDDWPVRFEGFVEPCLAEAVLVKMVYQDIFF
ncbi:phosphotransferase enzyme family protein [Histoplasma capsulatum H143]|uniref:Phosphotransferase enzyme family protein n=1 Tax=Ajellomyces capsulatus (strain H143) TaxID=544712 RepID=C6H986_AJECH|nr:phosphotransferase enzyme family protein [Histoplasma capsulatum H143]